MANQELCDLGESMLCREVKRGVRFVREVRVLKQFRMVSHDSFDEKDVVEEDCPSQTD